MSTLANHRAIADFLKRNTGLPEPLNIVVHNPDDGAPGAAAVVHLATFGATNPAKDLASWMHALDDGRPYVTYRVDWVDVTIVGHYAPHCAMVIKSSLFGVQAGTLLALAPADLHTEFNVAPSVLEQVAREASTSDIAGEQLAAALDAVTDIAQGEVAA